MYHHTTLLQLLLLAQFYGASAFVSPLNNCHSSSVTTHHNSELKTQNTATKNGINNYHLRRHHSIISTSLALKDDVDKDNEDPIVDEGSENNIAEKEKEERRPAEITILWNRITSTLFLSFSFGIQFLGVFFACGIVLNILGYGYRFDLNDGLVIDKIENIRTELQFEQEIIREERKDIRESAISGSGMSGAKDLVIPDVPEGLYDRFH